MRKWFPEILPMALILAVTAAAFSRCFGYGLVNMDDYCYLFGHRAVTDFAGWKSLVWCFTDVSEAIWMPLTWLSYAADHALFGRWFGGYHVHSVLVHAVNAVLVFVLLRQLFGSPRAASRTTGSSLCLVAALAWAIHPLRCESVVFLASRKDVLSFFWELLALIAWVRGSRCAADGRRAVLTAAAVVLFVLGAMCKPSVMTFPLLCLLLDLFVIREVRPLRYVVPGALMLGLGAFAGWQQAAGGATAEWAGEPVWARLAVAAAAFGVYVRNTVLPFGLAVQCIKQWPAWPRFLVPGAAISLLWGAFLLRRFGQCWAKRRETVSVGWLDGRPVRLTFGFPADAAFAGLAWFAVAVAPMLGVASFGYHAYADRFTYIPSVGLALALVVGLDALVRRLGTVRTLAPAACVLGALAATTAWQTGFWRDDLTLFMRTLEIDGDRNDVAHNIIGAHYFMETHELEKALEHFAKASSVREEAVVDVLPAEVMALVELGRDDEVPARLRSFEDVLVRRLGEDRARAVVRNAYGLDGREARLATTYRFARVASLLGKEPHLAEARRLLEELRDQREDCGEWQYLMWRCLALSGEAAAADAMLRKLLDPATKTGYSRFQFLRASHKPEAGK